MSMRGEGGGLGEEGGVEADAEGLPGGDDGEGGGENSGAEGGGQQEDCGDRLHPCLIPASIRKGECKGLVLVGGVLGECGVEDDADDGSWVAFDGGWGHNPLWVLWGGFSRGLGLADFGVGRVIGGHVHIFLVACAFA